MSESKPAHFVCYAQGLFYSSICTTMPIEEAVARMNVEHPSGTMNGWMLADEPFRGGAENGCPCNMNHAPGARHWLLNC